MTESKRDKFVRLASARMNNALKQIRLVGNLSSKNNYEYTKADVKKMVDALQNAIQDMEKRFLNESKKNEDFHF